MLLWQDWERRDGTIISKMAATDQRHARLNTWHLQIVTNNWRWQWPLPHLSISTPSSLAFRVLIFYLYVIFQTIFCPESLASTHSVESCSMVKSVSDSRNTPLVKEEMHVFFCLFCLLHLKWKSVPTVPADILNWGKILKMNKYSLKGAKLSDGQGEARDCWKYLIGGLTPGPGIYLWNSGKNHLRPGLTEQNKLVLIGTTIIWAISALHN